MGGQGSKDFSVRGMGNRWFKMYGLQIEAVLEIYGNSWKPVGWNFKNK